MFSRNSGNSRKFILTNLIKNVIFYLIQSRYGAGVVFDIGNQGAGKGDGFKDLF
jgi:hypothetical protein